MSRQGPDSRARSARWARYTQAAVGGAAPSARHSFRGQLRGWVRGLIQDARLRLDAANREQAEGAEQHRPDLRLVPAVAGAWLTAAVAISRPKEQLAAAAMLLGAAALVTAAGVCRRRCTRARSAGAHFAQARSGAVASGWLRARRVHRGPGRSGLAPSGRWQQWARQGLRVVAASGTTVFFAAACVLAVLLTVTLRQYAAGASPIAVAAGAGADMALTLEVATPPRLLESGHGPPRVVFEAVVLQANVHGQVLTGRMHIRVFATPAWMELQPGNKAVTAGRIVPAEAPDNVSGVLRPATEPLQASAAASGSRETVTAIRTAWVAAVTSVWEPLSADAAGLLPGMVMGDRSRLNASLSDSMKTVGLTHLTAVSGANCTLVLAFLMLILRSVRAPRTVAVAGSVAGLAGFVLVVGPDPSVLRAAVMGSIGAMAILGGRPRRTGALLAVAMLGLLLADPWLALDYAFILSVLATLGLHLVGRRCVRWLSVFLPLWLSQAVAIPLAAQMFCSPVIVLLQARLTPYTIAANMLAAPVISLVTTIGTLGMVAAAVVPPLAALCAAASGAGAWWVAAVARCMSALPAASLPWPRGIQGMVLMALLNLVLLTCLAAVVERQRAGAAAARLLARVPAGWRRRWGFGTVVAAAGAAAAWWTAALLKP